MANASLREQAYQYIYERIACGHLAAGSLVSELALAKEIGISRTPIREAIRQLVLQGLVEQVPRYGTVVRVPGRQELAELYEVREAIEGYAVAAASRRITPADLRLAARLVDQMHDVAGELREGGEVLDGALLRRFLAADMGFHMVLIRATGNRRMMKVVADTQILMRIFGHRRQVHDLRVVAHACRFHRRIVQALKAGNAAEARRWMVRHLRVSKRQTLEGFARPAASHAGEPIPLELPSYLLEELDRMDAGADPKVAADRSSAEPRYL